MDQNMDFTSIPSRKRRYSETDFIDEEQPATKVSGNNAGPAREVECQCPRCNQGRFYGRAKESVIREQVNEYAENGGVFNCYCLDLHQLRSDGILSCIGPGVKRLSLNASGITHLPEDSIIETSLTNIITINLQFNHLKSLPEALFGLPSLKNLFLGDNIGLQLPSMARIGSSVLEHLELSCCALQELPEDIGNLSMLECLDAPGNYIVDLPQSMVRMKRLNSLILCNNKLEKFPDVISQMDCLRNLELCGNSNLSFSEDWLLPQNIDRFVTVGADFNMIPSSIGNFKTITSLIIEDNCLETLPIELFRLPNLVHLVAAKNRLSHLPELSAEFGPFENKCNLMCEFNNNNLTTIPDFSICWPNLRYLELAANRIAHLPDHINHLTKVQVLSVSGNALKSLPTNMRDMKNLTSLRLSHNQLKCLPNSITSLPRLKDLDMRNNSLHSLPHMPFVSSYRARTLGKVTSANDEHYDRVYRMNYRRGAESMTKGLYEANFNDPNFATADLEEPCDSDEEDEEDTVVRGNGTCIDYVNNPNISVIPYMLGTAISFISWTGKDFGYGFNRGHQPNESNGFSTFMGSLYVAWLLNRHQCYQQSSEYQIELLNSEEVVSMGVVASPALQDIPRAAILTMDGVRPIVAKELDAEISEDCAIAVFPQGIDDVRGPLVTITNLGRKLTRVNYGRSIPLKELMLRKLYNMCYYPELKTFCYTSQQGVTRNGDGGGNSFINVGFVRYARQRTPKGRIVLKKENRELPSKIIDILHGGPNAFCGWPKCCGPIFSTMYFLIIRAVFRKDGPIGTMRVCDVNKQAVSVYFCSEFCQMSAHSSMYYYLDRSGTEKVLRHMYRHAQCFNNSEETKSAPTTQTS